jgi:ribosomal protein S8
MNKFTIQFLINLKNNSVLKKERIIVKYSKNLLQIISCLYKEGLIQSYKILNKNYICILLRYFQNKSTFADLKIISKPSKFRHLKLKELVNLSNKKFILFFSTNKGILTLNECKKHKIGGKALFYC